ncbi:hypothetical protein [Haloferula sp. BvORR071]|uniref:hypothetical protein n=1 Tax=Haloferula sp. BvORR071 TaxID=1396141 RepID=UPI0005534401|nr:hypothetical protein [Haloferula sp. BvORR071]
MWFTLSAWLTGTLIVSALWLGVTCIGRGRRSGAWWTMISGVSLLTVGPLAWAYGSYLIEHTPRPDPSKVPSYTYLGPSPSGVMMAGTGAALTTLGILLFGIGFAIHGQSMTRTRARLVELEQVTGAMSEELTRIRQGGTRA